MIERTEDYINVVFPRKKHSLNKYSKRIAQLFIVHIHTLNKIHKRAHLSLSLSHLLTLILQRLVDQFVKNLFSPYTYTCNCLFDFFLDSSPHSPPYPLSICFLISIEFSSYYSALRSFVRSVVFGRIIVHSSYCLFTIFSLIPRHS